MEQEHNHSHSHSHDRGHEGGFKEIPDVDEEIKHFKQVIKAFAIYEQTTNFWISVQEKSFSKIPQEHQALVPNMKQKFTAMREANTKNFQFILEIIESQQLFENQDMEEYYNIENSEITSPLERDIEKVKSTIRTFVRDWTEEGIEERNMCFKPILDKLGEKFATKESRQGIRVLCPGAGLGRLAFEIARLGFDCQGNEFSYFMLLSSSFILNHATKKNQFTIFPYLHQSSNVLRDMDQLRAVQLPDVIPGKEIPPGVEFSMCAGDFVEIYSNQISEWNVVVTCFFLDTAKNIIEYVKTLSKIIKPGGLWINIGPLLYHWADMPGEISIELSFEQLRGVILSSGFTFQEEKLLKTTYTNNKLSMMQLVYNSVFFVAVKT